MSKMCTFVSSYQTCFLCHILITNSVIRMIIHNFEIFHCTFCMIGSIRIIYLLAYQTFCMFYVIRCVVITPTEANCTSKWVRRPHEAASGSKLHYRTNSLEECQKACEFDPRCVAVDYRHPGVCWISTNPYHTHYESDYFDHYELVSRCNITAG